MSDELAALRELAAASREFLELHRRRKGVTEKECRESYARFVGAILEAEEITNGRDL